MFLTGKIKTLTSTGSPDYIICSQATSLLSLTNLNFKLSINKNGGTVQELVNTTDLSTISGLSFDTFTYGDFDIEFNNFTIDTVTSTFQAKINIFDKGTTNVVTWEKFNLFLEISKTGYQSFRNTFELYNYDVGNATSISNVTDTNGNEDFEIILINNINNLDGYGLQTKAASNLLLLRHPFTKEVYFYNMIGTQGNISYYYEGNIVGEGDKGHLINESNTFIEQTISLTNDSCTSGKMCLEKVWYPKLVTSYLSANTCEDCTNNLANTTISYYLDATLTSTYSINGTKYFLSEFMTNKIFISVLNYKSEVIEDDEYTEQVTLAQWVLDNTQFLDPVDLVFVPSEIGENIININSVYQYTKNSDSSVVKLFECVKIYNLPTCNWWTIKANELCGSYTINNCSSRTLILILQLLDENKVFQDISTNTINSFENLDLSFSTDGIYMLKISYTESLTTTTIYYSLPVYCNLQNCILKYTKETLCKSIENNCIPKSHYNFNGLVINAHSYFLLLNKELNDNFIYQTISTSKLEELYTLKTFLDRFEGYCEDSNSVCLPCNE